MNLGLVSDMQMLLDRSQLQARGLLRHQSSPCARVIKYKLNIFLAVSSLVKDRPLSGRFGVGFAIKFSCAFKFTWTVAEAKVYLGMLSLCMDGLPNFCHTSYA